MSSPKVALITGITGQDDALLAELHLEKRYVVHGIKRRSSLINTDRVDYFRPTEVDILIGDATKAGKILGWRHTTTFEQLVGEMVAADLIVMKQGRHI